MQLVLRTSSCEQLAEDARTPWFLVCSLGYASSFRDTVGCDDHHYGRNAVERSGPWAPVEQRPDTARNDTRASVLIKVTLLGFSAFLASSDAAATLLCSVAQS